MGQPLLVNSGDRSGGPVSQDGADQIPNQGLGPRFDGLGADQAPFSNKLA